MKYIKYIFLPKFRIIIVLNVNLITCYFLPKKKKTLETGTSVILIIIYPSLNLTIEVFYVNPPFPRGKNNNNNKLSEYIFNSILSRTKLSLTHTAIKEHLF